MKKLSKRTVALLVSSVFVISALVTLSILFLFNNIANYDKLFIDVDKYQSIGVAARPKTMPKNAVSAASNATVNRLVGVNLDGEVEELIFKDKNGKKVKQSLSIYSIDFFKNFTFVVFCEDTDDAADCHVNSGRFHGDYMSFAYCINNKTGKIFALNETFLKNTRENIFSAYFVSKGYPKDISVSESDDAVYFGLEKDGYHDNYNILKISATENDELEIKQITNNEPGYRLYLSFVDKYNNVFIAGYHGSDAYSMIKTSGQVVPLTEGAVRAINGKAYNSAGTKYYDVNGELQWVNDQDHDEAVALTWVCNDAYITTIDSWDYYYNSSVNYNDPSSIYKVKNKANDNFEIIKVTDLESSYGFITAGSKLYFLKSSKIVCYDVATDIQTEITGYTGYTFTTIQSNNLGEVLFTARDDYQNNVNGIIRSNGDVEINVTKATFEVFYLQPLN